MIDFSMDCYTDEIVIFISAPFRYTFSILLIWIEPILLVVFELSGGRRG